MLASLCVRVDVPPFIHLLSSSGRPVRPSREHLLILFLPSYPPISRLYLCIRTCSACSTMPSSHNSTYYTPLSPVIFSNPTHSHPRHQCSTIGLSPIAPTNPSISIPCTQLPACCVRLSVLISCVSPSTPCSARVERGNFCFRPPTCCTLGSEWLHRAECGFALPVWRLGPWTRVEACGSSCCCLCRDARSASSSWRCADSVGLAGAYSLRWRAQSPRDKGNSHTVSRQRGAGATA